MYVCVCGGGDLMNSLFFSWSVEIFRGGGLLGGGGGVD